MRAPLRFYLRLVAGAAVIAAVLTVWGLVRGDLGFGRDSAPASTTPTTGTAGPSTTQAGGARGCLGGENAQAAAIIAQQQAPLTPTGAAEFAASLMRWYWVYPRVKPMAEDGASLWVPGIARDLTTPQWPHASNGDTAYASFLAGHYRIESATADTVVVSVQFTSVYTGADTKMDTHYSTSELTLKTVDGRWRLSAATVRRQANEVIAGGQPYRQGC
jgi:hypothetical protein